MNYTTKTDRLTKEGGWDHTIVTVFGDDKVLGEYTRNYSQFYKTFFPFTRDGQDYALYSHEYTATRVMALPSMRDLGGEERDGFGFCPVEFYVDSKGGGWVAGCIWGDDSSWKVQTIDLSGVAEGKIKRADTLGYVELERAETLEEFVKDYLDEDSVIDRLEAGRDHLVLAMKHLHRLGGVVPLEALDKIEEATEAVKAALQAQDAL